jgi:hypothetical protein
MPMTTRPGVPTPNCRAKPIIVEQNAIIAATERSISPEMITRAMAKAIRAFSVKLKVESDMDHGFRKYGVAKELATKIAIATNNSRDCHEKIADRSQLSRRSGIRRI